jgi:hypothetical protein
VRPKITLWTEERTISSNAKVVLIWAQRAPVGAKVLCCMAFNVLYDKGLSITSMMSHAKAEFERQVSPAMQGCVRIPVFDLHKCNWHTQSFYLTNCHLGEYNLEPPRNGIVSKAIVANELQRCLLYNIAMFNNATAPTAAPAAKSHVAPVTVTGCVCLN